MYLIGLDFIFAISTCISDEDIIHTFSTYAAMNTSDREGEKTLVTLKLVCLFRRRISKLVWWQKTALSECPHEYEEISFPQQMRNRT